MLDALGSAGTQAAGLWEFNADGAMSKHLHPGKAAFNGVLAADLARAGFTGATRILEGERGFFRAMSTDARRDAHHRRPRASDGRSARTATRCGRAAATRTRRSTSRVELRAQRGWIADDACATIAAIRHRDVRARLRDREGARIRARRTQAKFSLAYCVAAALLDGGAPLDVVRRRPLLDRRRASIARRRRRCCDGRRVTVADDLTAKYPGGVADARCASTLADGTDAERARATIPVGNPENPVSTAQLEEKFSALVAPRWGDDVVRARARRRRDRSSRSAT